ncbi:MAG: lytic transglycosylase domain-containing protein [Deltaproteobacteria bacterium]|nr:lytic transglycosylase domain-containing protein [Deltaproteobacteria bacterium]
MNKKIKMTIFAIFFFTAGLIAAFSCNNMVYGNILGTDAEKPEIAASFPTVHDFALPSTLSLCGETIPLENSHVWEMLDREFNITVWDRAQVFMYLKRAGRYFPYIEKKLSEAGMPMDLKYLAVAESALLTYARSSDGARGMWQFMKLAARSNGLRRDNIVDERLNFEHSTKAAIKYLKYLKRKFNTWPLALAAYNGGETRIRKAIREQKTRDYYRLNLPLETERYVFRIAAIKIVMDNPARYGYHLSQERVYRPHKYDIIHVNIKKTIQITEFAQFFGTDFKAVKELNPQFLKSYLPQGKYTVNVPITS